MKKDTLKLASLSGAIGGAIGSGVRGGLGGGLLGGVTGGLTSIIKNRHSKDERKNNSDFVKGKKRNANWCTNRCRIRSR